MSMTAFSIAVGISPTVASTPPYWMSIFISPLDRLAVSSTAHCAAAAYIEQHCGRCSPQRRVVSADATAVIAADAVSAATIVFMIFSIELLPETSSRDCATRASTRLRDRAGLTQSGGQLPSIGRRKRPSCMRMSPST